MLCFCLFGFQRDSNYQKRTLVFKYLLFKIFAFIAQRIGNKRVKKMKRLSTQKKKNEGSKKILGAINSNYFKNILIVKQFLISMDG